VTRARRLTTGAAVAVGLAVGGAACGGGTTSPDATQAVETFSGVLTPGGAGTYSIDVQDGEVDVVLSSLSPQTTITVGLGLGQPDSTGCGLFDATGSARAGTVLVDPVPAGTYCVVIYDVGNVQGSESYTLTVDHY
jgi:hypothetical protein